MSWLMKLQKGYVPDECVCGQNTAQMLCNLDVSTALEQEKEAAEVLSLYRQMKLHRQFVKCEDLDANFRKNQIYTNKRLLSEISQKIEDGNINYPKTFQGLTDDMNTNTILTAIQLRKQHLVDDPLSGQNP